MRPRQVANSGVYIHQSLGEHGLKEAMTYRLLLPCYRAVRGRGKLSNCSYFPPHTSSIRGRVQLTV
jgi:hypothetical protein